MFDLKIQKIEDSLGVVLPREVLKKWAIGDGDKVLLTEAPNGSYRITPYDPEFEKQMRLVEESMARYRNTLRALSE